MSEKELKELRDIKKLLILQLLKMDVQPDSITTVLGMDRGDFSKAFPVRKLLKRKCK